MLSWPWANAPKGAALSYACLWAAIALGQAFLATLGFEHGSAALSPWFNVFFAAVFAGFAFGNFSQYRKLTRTHAARSSGEQNR